MRFSDDTKSPEPTETVKHIDDPVTHRDEALFLSWHVKLGHAPFRNIRWAAKLGILPSKLQHCRNVVCPACLYGKQKRRPWRSKGAKAQDHRIKKAMSPGECVSVDQLISGTPGLVGQTTGKLTTARYKVATIFVDHYSDLDYVHVQESTLAHDTIKAKQCFERFCLESKFSIVMLIMASSRAEPLSTRSIEKGSQSRSVQLMPIIRMEERRKEFATCRRVPGPCCYTPDSGGQKL